MFSNGWRSAIAMIGVSLATVLALGSPASAQLKGQLAQAFELPDLTGQVKRVDAARDHRGKLIVFFTSW